MAKTSSNEGRTSLAVATWPPLAVIASTTSGSAVDASSTRTRNVLGPCRSTLRTMGRSSMTAPSNGSVVLISGNIPFDTQVASVFVYKQIESDNPVGAAAVSVVLLVLSLLVLVAIRWFGAWGARHER